ncbi:MAG: hypothetical protein ACTSU2_17560 [Promethearchaeota archaeon]
MKNKLRELYKRTYEIWDNIKSLRDFYLKPSCPFCDTYDCTNCKIDHRLCGGRDCIYIKIEYAYKQYDEDYMLRLIQDGLKMIKHIIK